MDKVLVLCIADVTRRYGASTFVYTDSVMIKAEFEDQVYPKFDDHFLKLCRHDPGILRWKMTTYLPQAPLQKPRSLH